MIPFLENLSKILFHNTKEEKKTSDFDEYSFIFHSYWDGFLYIMILVRQQERGVFSMDEKSAWSCFQETGRVQDYLVYAQLKHNAQQIKEGPDAVEYTGTDHQDFGSGRE